MADPVRTARRVQFGAFEADLCARELWKAGRKRRLASQPFAILAALLERPGEVVSREELQKRLWPDTFVDVDHNLNATINKVREALEDSSDRPRFIETLPRRGYRFIAPVTPVESLVIQPAPSPALDPPLMPAPPQPDSSTVLGMASTGAVEAPSVPAPARDAPRIRGGFKRWPWLVAAAAVLAVAWLLRPALPPPEVTGVTQLTQDEEMKTISWPIPAPMATDGSNIYFWELVGGQVELRQVAAGGGEVIPIHTSGHFGGLDAVSPTQPELLFRGPSAPGAISSPGTEVPGLWALPLPGGQPRRVGNITAYDATYAPGGNTIFFTSGHDIFTANSNGSDPRKILSIAEGFPFWPRVSPDGRLLLFSVSKPALRTFALWESHADGSHPRQLLAGWESPTDECCGSWTRDGRYFIFQATHEGTSALWAMRAKGEWWRKVSHAPMRLTLEDMDSLSPLPGRNGAKVFFTGATRKSEIIRYQPGTHTFAPFLMGVSARSLTFSPDKTKVAYVSYPEGDLWESNTDGTGRRELTFSPLEVGLPHWSPDGTQIVFSACRAGQPWQLFVVPAGGGDTRQLTFGELDHGNSSWSPDGKLLAFGEGATAARASSGNAIHILDPATSRVTDVPGSSHMFWPRWSPDGRYLLTIAANYEKLFLYDFDLHRWSVLVSMEADYPSWSADGKCVYFSETLAKGMPVYRVCLANREPEHIVDLSAGGTPILGPGGDWVGLGPDDSILATRNIGTEEIYALNVKFPR